MINHELELDGVLERYASRMAAQGYKLVREPRGNELPGFLGSYRPDAVLFGKPNTLVEVVYKGKPDIEAKIAALKSALEGHDDWRLEVLYAGVLPPTVPRASNDRLLGILQHVHTLDERDPGAFLMLWPVLEATTRILVPSETKRPQSPGRVVELLASGGYIVPDDADFLRQSAALRNRLIHGDLEVEVPPLLRQQTERIARQLVGSLLPPPDEVHVYR